MGFTSYCILPLTQLGRLAAGSYLSVNVEVSRRRLHRVHVVIGDFMILERIVSRVSV